MSAILNENCTASFQLSDLERYLDAFFSTHPINNSVFTDDIANLKTRYIKSSQQYDREIFSASNAFINRNKKDTMCHICATVHPMTTAVRLYKKKLFDINQTALALISRFENL